jgi:hypothetical protein
MTNPKQISKMHKTLSVKEPFTEKEQIQYNKKDQSMIRNIQILNKFTKKEAIGLLKQYKGTSKTTLKRIARAYKKKGLLSANYPKEKPERRGYIPHTKKLPEHTRNVQKTSHIKTHNWLSKPENINARNYTRVEKGFKKYPDASSQELQHGVNSKWSQEFRRKQGLSLKYEGRIIK